MSGRQNDGAPARARSRAGDTSAEVDSRAPARTGEAPATPASVLAAEIKALVQAGEREAARDRFGSLVALLQRRGLRIAYHYLRDAADADEAVQDAFVKVFLHIERYREELSFDVWFLRILVNACLDRLKSRTRQHRWIAAPLEDHDERPVEQAAGTTPSTEQDLMARERWQQVLDTVATLPDRQRLVFTLSHLDERSALEISEMTGMSPATVRVHLFRAIRKLRARLGEEA